MSQRSQELSATFSDLYSSEIAEDLMQVVDSQDLLNMPFEESFPDGTHPQDTFYTEENTVDIKDIAFLPMITVPGLIQPLPANKLFSNEEYAGPYNFDVSVVPNHNKSKNPWVYSPALNKIFMDMNQPFPVDFKIDNDLSHVPLYVRTTLQYSDQHNAGNPVVRCIQHNYPADNSNKDIPEYVRQHVIRCGNKQTQYIGSIDKDQLLSLGFPLAMPQAGSESVRELFSFVCMSSCPNPGMNRRAVEVIFTLENINADVLGRKCLKVRVCACPKRDMAKEEKELCKNGNPVPRGKKRKLDNPHNPSAPAGKVMPNQDFKPYRLENLEFMGKQNLLEILGFARKTYLAKAYQLRGQPGEQLMTKNVEDIDAAIRQLL